MVNPGVNLIKLFGVNLLTHYYKLDLFIEVQQILLMLNGLAYKKVLVELHKNSFIRSTLEQLVNSQNVSKIGANLTKIFIS